MPAALFIYSKFGRMADYDYLCRSNARMAESVDATVSNTVGGDPSRFDPGSGYEYRLKIAGFSAGIFVW